jgi:hypothetical protein
VSEIVDVHETTAHLLRLLEEPCAGKWIVISAVTNAAVRVEIDAMLLISSDRALLGPA